MKSLLLFLLTNILIFAQILNFGNNFLFNPADSLIFKDNNYNDKHWKVISINTNWDNSGYAQFDGIGWYRYHFTFDKTIKDKYVYLILGKIDDADETYLNGVLIGKTGVFPPNAESQWGKIRAYKIDKKMLKQNNVLSIRVCDMGGPGGIYQGPFGIYSEKQYQELSKDLLNNDYKYLVTSNGLMCAIINKFSGKIEKVLPEIFQSFDSTNVVLPLIENLELVKNDKLINIYYYKNTNVIRAEFTNYSIDYYTPFDIGKRIFIVKITTKKLNDSLTLPFSNPKDNFKIFDIKKDKTTRYLIFTYDYTPTIDIMNDIINEKVYNENINYLTNLFKNVKLPKFLSKDEKNLFEQSITVLKMAQVSKYHNNKLSQGQILASLPPGMWNIAWIRDGVYSIFALNNLGLFDEAKLALEFYLNAKANHYKTYYHIDGKDYGIGVDYQISVCRYFGNGTEESDANNDGPNIEIDGFGLFLQAFADYVVKSNDNDLFERYHQKIYDKIIIPIIHNIDSNNLIRKESGAWERHLPGKQFAYTSVSCAKGLLDYANLCKEKDPELYEKLVNYYEKLKQGINLLLVDNKYYRGTFENINKDEIEHFDALTFEIFNSNISNDKNLFKSHYEVYSKKLRINAFRGFARVNSNDWYDRKEWIFIDFRVATALNKFGYKNEADKLVKWILYNAKKNNNLIPELLDEITAKYEGAIPMVGFGAASFINYLFER